MANKSTISQSGPVTLRPEKGPKRRFVCTIHYKSIFMTGMFTQYFINTMLWQNSDYSYYYSFK